MKHQSNEYPGFIPRQGAGAYFLVTVLFLLWGIPNNLNDILITQFMKSFDINRFQAGLVQSAFYMGYFILAIPTGIFMERFSYKAGMVTGLLLFAFGCLLFYPSALAQEYSYFLISLFVIASGLTFLETGANLFVLRLGSDATSARRINFSQAFNPIGAVAGVVIGTVFILSGIELSQTEVMQLKQQGNYAAYLETETMRVVKPYLYIGVFSLLWAILMIFTKFPAISEDSEREQISLGALRQLLSNRIFRMGVLSQFLYCGAQTCTWSFFIQYVQDYTGQSEKTAGYYLTGTLAAFGVGRFMASYLMKRTSPAKLMASFCVANIVLVVIAIIFPGHWGVWALLLTSFFMSLVYPTNFAISIKSLPSHIKLGGGIMVMAIVGGAVFPPLMGYFAELWQSMAWAMSIPLLCYLYIFYFARIGDNPHTT